MLTLKCFLFAMFLLLIAFVIKSVPMRNPFKLIFIFGKKGSSKTTLLQKMLDIHKRRGWITWSSDKGLTADYYFDFMQYGDYTFPPNSFVVCDEVGTYIHSRDFKTFPKKMRDIFKMQRKNKVKMVLASQSFDIDKSVRDLCDEMYLCKRIGCISLAKKIKKSFVLTLATSDAPSNIAENLQFDFFTTWIWTYIPKYIKEFDTLYVSDKTPVFPQYKPDKMYSEPET